MCHECHSTVGSEFGVVSLVIRDRERKRIAFSDLEASLCSAEAKKLNARQMSTDPYTLPQDIFYALQLAEGGLNPFTGAVPAGNSYTASNQVIYIDAPMIAQAFPRAVRMFEEELAAHSMGWARKVRNRWQPAEWATEVYERIARTLNTSRTEVKGLIGK